MRAASEKLDVATSSVSRQLGELEKELGIPLIEKGLRVIKLTEAGEIACHYFREKQDEEEVFLSKIEELRNIRRGKIILAIGEAFITNGFSGVLQKFMHSYPGISIRVKMSGTNDSVALVRSSFGGERHFIGNSIR